MQIAWPYITNIFSFGERILLEYSTCHVGLSNSIVWLMKLICCLIFLIVVANGYVLITLIGA